MPRKLFLLVVGFCRFCAWKGLASWRGLLGLFFFGCVGPLPLVAMLALYHVSYGIPPIAYLTARLTDTSPLFTA